MLKQIKNHCLNLLWKSRCKAFPYHNLEHTLEVYQHVQTIANFEGISNQDILILQVAALFHDTGLSASFEGHELISVNNAHLYLSYIGFSETDINKVEMCIMSTKMPQLPQKKLEKIICDADLFHLSQPNYFIKSELLKIEWERYCGVLFTEEEWQVANMGFLSKHAYHSQYGEKFLTSGKNKNIDKLKMMLP